MSSSRIGLCIVGQKGQAVLSALAGNAEIDFIVTYNDSAVSDSSYEEIIATAKQYDISLIEGKKLPEERIERVDKILLAGWQYLLKGDLTKFIVFHDSYLPESKGWGPTVNALITGKSYLGATAFQPTEKVDTGLVYARRKISITYPLKIRDALKIVADLYSELALEVVQIEKPVEEMSGEESFCLWRDNEDYFVDWNQSAGAIVRFIDAVGEPYDGAKAYANDILLTILKAKELDDMVIEDREHHIGKMLRFEGEDPVVICKKGIVQLTSVVHDGTPFTFQKLKIRFRKERP